MSKSTYALAMISLLALPLAGGEAEAGSKWKRWFFIEDQYSDDYEQGLTPEEFASLYADDFDESYYEPEVAPAKKKEQATKNKKKAVTGTAAKPKASTAKTTATKSVTAPTKTASVAAPETTVSAKKAEDAPIKGGLTCAKAEDIVSDFGFTAVKAADCGGQVFAFNAMRDGKPYAIKLNAKSGELTEVRKVQ